MGTGAQIAALENEDMEKIRKLSVISVDVSGNEKRATSIDVDTTVSPTHSSRFRNYDIDVSHSTPRKAKASDEYT